MSNRRGRIDKSKLAIGIPNRVRDPRHLEFIRSLMCVRCKVTPCEAAHIRAGTKGGTGLKPGDSWTVPLCSLHHRAQHSQGEISFWGDVEPVLRLAWDLYGMSGDKEKAIFRIMQFQREVRWPST